MQYNIMKLLQLLLMFFSISIFSDALSTNTAASMKNEMITSMKKLNKAVIIGAGPSGLSAALMLQQYHGCEDITVIEKRPKNSFESEKAYLYLVDTRGQQMTNLLGLTTRIYSKAVSSFNFKELNVLLPNGENKVQKLPVGAMGSEEKYWLPRSALLDVFLDRIAEVNQLALANNKPEPIKLAFDAACEDFNVSNDGKIVVKAGDNSYDCDLLLGCDGISSAVRSWMGNAAKVSVTPSKRFSMTKYNSDAAGLRYKMITLKNRFLIPSRNATGEKEQSIPESGYAIRSTGTTRKTRFSYGLLPVKGDNPRTANVICIPQHKIWSIKTFSELKEFLQKSIPQLPVEDYATDEELQRFLDAKPGVFPRPQYSSDAQLTFQSTQDKTGRSDPSSAAVLLGDSLHAFPPDLGQGVNSALVDVLTLHESLKTSNGDIAKAASLYEEKRLPEAIALCKIMTFGYPHQYKQAPIKGRLFLINFALRLALNKVFPKLFAPPAFFMVQKSENSYQQILRYAHGTTRNIIAILMLLSGMISFPLLRPKLLKFLPFS